MPENYAPALHFLQPISGATTYDADTSATRKAETRRRFLRERQTALTLEVNALEVKLGINHRWQPGDAQYVKVTDYIATRKYHRALGALQRLVVQRLFELHRLNLAQTGKFSVHHAAALPHGLIAQVIGSVPTSRSTCKPAAARFAPRSTTTTTRRPP